MKIFITLLFFMITFNSAFSQKKITKINGKSYLGFIKEEDKKKIKFKTTDDFVLIIKKKDIEEIEESYSEIKTKDGKTYDVHILEDKEKSYLVKEDEKVFEIKKKNIKEIDFGKKSSSKEINYMLGVSSGFPNLYNIFAAKYFDNTAVRLELGYFNSDLFGANISYDYIFYRGKKSSHRINLVAGYFHNKQDDVFYIGPSYSLKYGFWFTELGAGINTHEDFLFLPLFKFGIAFEF